MTQNRLLMIKEDIMASVNEEITKYHLFLMRSMTVLEGFIENLQISDEGELPEEVMNIIPSIKPNRFNLNSSQIQEDFSRALAGEYVYFRETLRKQANS